MDDILLISSRDLGIDLVITQLRSHLDVKDLGHVHHFLGVSFKRDSTGAWMNQRHYIERILRRFKMTYCKPVNTPMCLPTASDPSSESVDQTLYREMIGALLFIYTRTRPDISVAVSILSRNKADPREEHIVAVRRMLRYLRGTSNYGLSISERKGNLIAFADWIGEETLSIESQHRETCSRLVALQFPGKRRSKISWNCLPPRTNWSLLAMHVRKSFGCGTF